MKVYVALQYGFDEGYLDSDGVYVLGVRLSNERAEQLVEDVKENEIQEQMDQMDQDLTEDERRASATESLLEYYEFHVIPTDLDEELTYEHSPEGKISLKES